MKRVVLVSLLLSGCTARQPCPPPPDLLVVTPPAAMIELEPVPAVPASLERQSEVARYLEALHKWGNRGWDRIKAIREWSETRGREHLRTGPAGN